MLPFRSSWASSRPRQRHPQPSNSSSQQQWKCHTSNQDNGSWGPGRDTTLAQQKKALGVYCSFCRSHTTLSIASRALFGCSAEMQQHSTQRALQLHMFQSQLLCHGHSTMWVRSSVQDLAVICFCWAAPIAGTTVMVMCLWKLSMQHRAGSATTHRSC
ncbi:hypothetical protein COO60DRAFT_378311 [Scenedesmus sp. NREL 46B-D3]|nr:hypothetical protein COO60DRAFT_378311 [Scenedesmus sp. NREL 46B-D3]